MVVGLKIFEPNINNKTFSHWPVLCSLNDGKKVIQEGLEILQKIRSVSAERKFVVPHLLIVL